MINHEGQIEKNREIIYILGCPNHLDLLIDCAGVAELVDARDLKSLVG